MNWLTKQVSLYSSQTDTTGASESLRDILHCPEIDEIAAICELRKLEPNEPDYKIQSSRLKSGLRLFSPSALLQSRKAGNVHVIEYSGLMQLDFDFKDIQDYDVEELKQCVFSLPFTAFCGLSCSGLGFYSLIAIEEPERLKEYAEHCFEILKQYGIKPDTSKGRNPQDLRYMSYDSNMLIRENPTPLKIARFRCKEILRVATQAIPSLNGNKLVNKGLFMIATASKGNRWATVQAVAYTLGGICDPALLATITNEIQRNPEFTGEEDKYIRCAKACFSAGTRNPLKK